jgi:nitrogen fixation NifU-like protein
VDRQTAIARLLDHYEHPRNNGPLDAAAAVVEGGHADCGDRVTIYLAVDSGDETITNVTFEGQGCTISQASASILTEIAAGRPLSEIDQLDDTAMIDMLGREIVRTRTRCATLALNTLKTAIHKYRRDQR